ncbi:MAG: FtsQ-type POTRA domain-containing protein [Verrucomicrobiota bacterium]
MRKIWSRRNRSKNRFKQVRRPIAPLSDAGEWFYLEANTERQIESTGEGGVSGFRETAVKAASKSRQSRGPKRVATWAVRFLAVACLLATVGLGTRWIYSEIFQRNESFVVQSVTTQTDGLLDSDKIEEVAGLESGMMLMDLDLDLIRERIEALPSVKSAVVSRVMPDRLNVNVRERIPIAWLSCPVRGIRPWDMERGFLLDEDGVLFRCSELTEVIKALPVVESYKIPDPEHGVPLGDNSVSAALGLIAKVETKTDLGGRTVRVVRIRNEWSLEARFVDGLRVSFGVHEAERGLQDLATILSKVEGAGGALASVNVVTARNIPVVFSDSFDTSLLKDPSDPPAVPRIELETTGDGQDEHLRSILNGG